MNQPLPIQNKSIFLFFFLLLGTTFCFGQEKALYYPEDPIVNNHDSLKYYLRKNHYEIDTNAAAIKLWELGDVSVFRNYGPILAVMQFKVSTLLKFNTHEAVQNFSLDYLPMNLSRLPISVHGTVYNLENDSIKKDTFSFSPKALSKSDKFIEVPDLKAGSILELSVESIVSLGVSSLTMLPTWHFDCKYPTLFSAYFADFPDFYTYRNIMSASVPFKEVKTNEDLTSGNATFIRTNAKDYMILEAWERKDIPAFKKEVHMPSPETFREHVTVQFTSINVNKYINLKVLDNWDQVSKNVFKSYPELKTVFRNNRFLEKSLKKIIDNDSTSLQKAQSIYRFVRDTFTKTDESYFDRTNTDFNLKKLLASRNGSEQEINLLLSALMEKAGLQCNMVMVSSKPNPPLSPDYPDVKEINSLICCLKIDNKTYFLDASDKELPFGLLNPEYYNGYSRALSEKPFAVNISADSLTDHSVIYAEITPDSSNRTLHLQLIEKLDNFAALSIRKAANGNKEKAEALLKATYNSSNFEIKNVEIKGLNNPDVPLKIIYLATFQLPKEESNIYLPLYFDKIRDENPFPDEKRKYPVDMGCRTSYSYYLHFHYPDNYRISEVPKSTELKLANGKADFSTTISNDSTQHLLSARANFQTTSAEFAVSDYNALRSLWAAMLNQTNQYISLVKKNP